ncbi:MAG: 1,4-dihydroxy-2-naphthoate octaprenyltransferase [Candidatus Bathyarchaeia archaeon]|jgi:1,4-dihydroxy-2-naphthoate octaprenyltransferase
MSKAKVWWQAFRYHFVPPSIFPAVLGGLVSWATKAGFLSLYFLLVLVAIIINHIGLNMTDDYYDYKHSVDKLKLGEKNPYTGGSGTLSSGLLSPQSMFKAFTLCYIVTVSVGFYLTLTRGLPILAFGFIGVFCAIFYTAPPISFGHHGLGELAMLVNFGSVIGLGAFYVQAHTITLQPFLASLPLGIMLFSMIVINEIPDIEEDRAAGKLTLVARYGKKAGAKLYIASWICTYGVIVGSVAFQILPLYTLFALLSLPLVYRSIKILLHNYDDPKRMAPANLDMIKAHSITGFGLIAGYAIQGLVNKANAFQLLFILVLLAAVYAPVAWMLLNTKKRN